MEMSPAVSVIPYISMKGIPIDSKKRKRAAPAGAPPEKRTRMLPPIRRRIARPTSRSATSVWSPRLSGAFRKA